MKYEQNHLNAKKKYWRKLKSCGITVTVLLPMLLTSCVWNLKGREKNLRIYQPSTLRLEKNQKVQTLDGYYVPQVDEVWHSDLRYRKLENELNYNYK